MTLKEIRMPKGVKDIDDLIRSGVKVPEPIPTRGRAEEASQAVPAEPMLDFDDFLLKESSKDMEKKMLEDVFVLGRMAITGQFTVFYGGPNAGKTLIGLKLLVEAIQSGEIAGANVYYINADDTYKGIALKKRLAEEYGFKMLVPGMGGFKAEMLAEILRFRSSSDKARGTIVILDTLKKFTDLMSKGASSAFGDVQRVFTSSGGTIIGYAHVNKAKNDDGNSIHAGTTDIIDDGDCAYILDVIEDDGDTKTVKFRNIKDRGDVAQVVNYQYKSKGNNPTMPYLELFYSVQEVSASTAIEAGKRAAAANLIADNQDHIIAVSSSISLGSTGKTDLIATLMERGLSRKAANKVLDDHTGTNKLDGHRWNSRKGERNSLNYFTL